MGALDGIKVLDLSRVLAGPYGTQILADHGAEVWKVEIPGKGDDTRAFGPPFQNGESAYFMSVNRNKRSITINMKSNDGIEIIKNLLLKADVLIENFRPGTLDKFGLDADSALKMNPRLIYCSVSGFGQTGPWSRKPGYDLAIQGMGGIMSLTGEPDGPPTKVGTSIADIISGIYAAQGILLALVARNKTGRGQKIDISMLDGQISLLTYQAGIYFAEGKSPMRKGNQHPTICPYETFKTKDGYLNLAVGNDKLWLSFCELINRPDLKSDERFTTNPKRVACRNILFPILSEIFSTRSTAEWISLLEKAGIPAGPIFTVEEVLEHEQTKAREMVVAMEHPKAGRIRLTGIPIKLSDTPGKIKTPPPVAGQHTEEILRNVLGYSKEKIEELRKSGAI
ncbi:MAG: formyl-CoA transferase [Candidatus Hydrogenedentes bacterium CG07_land_8_20_14_0_80_42_17]|nr:MAG: formyl-CoA transferase [Candidatus Hydrogenedentes bacterium CG07_land_8_20_14_0_80_42_17]